MEDINGGSGAEGKNARIEKIVNHPIVDRQVALHVRNLREVFIDPKFRTTETDLKTGKILEDYVRLIAAKFEEIKDIEPVNTSDPEWAERLGSKTFAIAQKHLVGLMDGKFLAERLSDVLGGEPEDWLSKEKDDLMAIIAMRILHDTLAVAYCLRLNIDPEELREQA